MSQEQTTDEAQQLRATIAALEAQRAVLGDAVVETALAPLRQKLAALAGAPPTAERKRVTVLFADVSGYTALSENLDPEDVTNIMNRLFEVLTAQITQCSGTVDKYSGDAVMALFGAARALENHEEMAVRAALGMQKTLAAFSAELEQEWGFSLRMRIGLNTGEVLAGLVGAEGARSYTVMGDTVNLASRLEHACTVGRVMISSATAQRLQAIFDLEPPQQIVVKGKTEPITVYLVVGEKAERGHVRGVAGLHAPMIGRDAELAALQQAFEQALQAHCWKAAVITGEAGIGKSRLRREFVAWLSQAYPDARLLSGRCFVHTQATPYAVMADLVRALFNLGQDASVAVSLDSLAAGLRALVPGVDETEFRYRLGSLAGVLQVAWPEDPLLKLSPEQRRDRTLLSLEQLFTAAATFSPLILVVDDLHWADALSFALIGRLLEMARRGLASGNAALVLGISRPAEEKGSALDEMLERMARPPHLGLFLAPLDAAQAGTLISELLARSGIPAAIGSLIVERSQGNPFFVEEILRSLIEDGTISQDPATGGWQVTREVAEVRVPSTVQGVLAARLDRLAPFDKNTAQHAAIIGRTFWQRLLAESVGRSEFAGDESTVEASLARLETRQLVLRLGESQISDDWEWIFRHVLAQEVAYESVPRAVRRRVHAEVGRWLERHMDDRGGRLVPLIAYHYERGAVPDKAVRYLRLAGEQAAAQFASNDAVDYFSRALQLLSEEASGKSRALQLLPEVSSEENRVVRMRYALLLGREAAYRLLGQREKQAADLEELKAVAASTGDPRQWAEVSRRWANYCEAVSDFPAALAAAQESARWAEQAGDAHLKVEAMVDRGIALWRQGQYDESRACLSESLALAQQGNDRAGEAISLHNLGTVAYLQEDLDSALSYLEKAFAIRRDIEDLQGEANSLVNLVAVYHGRGDLVQARSANEQALQIYQTIGDRRGEAHALSNLAIIVHGLGDLAKAREHNERALALFQAAGEPHGEALVANNLGLVFHDLGDDPAAQRYCERALEVNRTIGDRLGEGYSLTYLALVLEGLARWDEAAQAYQAALELRREIGQDAAIVDDQAGLARVALAQGDAQEALRQVAQVQEWLAGHGVNGVEYPIRVYLTLADVLGAAGQAQEAHQALQQAHTLLLEQAASFSDPAARQSFLEQVPLHKKLLERVGPYLPINAN